MAAKTHPLIGFMQDYWVLDDRAPGPLAAQIHASFEMWCEEHRRSDLIDSYPPNLLLRGIREIDAYSFLHDVKTHGRVRRYPGIRQRTKDDDKSEEKKAERSAPPAGKGYRRY
jgi:hypothetical protein